MGSSEVNSTTIPTWIQTHNLWSWVWRSMNKLAQGWLGAKSQLLAYPLWQSPNSKELAWQFHNLANKSPNSKELAWQFGQQVAYFKGTSMTIPYFGHQVT